MIQDEMNEKIFALNVGQIYREEQKFIRHAINQETQMMMIIIIIIITIIIQLWTLYKIV